MVLQIEDVAPLHPDMLANPRERTVQRIGIGGANADGIGLQWRKMADRFHDQVAVLKPIS